MLSRPLAPQGRRTPPSWPPRPSTTAAGWPPSGPWPMLPPRLPPARASGRRTWPPSGPPWLLAGAAHDPLDSTSSVLSVGTQQRAVALLLKESETFEALGSRFSQASPVSHGLALAKRQGLPRVVLLRGPQVRLYSVRSDTRAGRKGPAETFTEINLSLLGPDAAGYLPLLFGARALADDGTITEILRRSADFATELGSRLREPSSVAKSAD